MKTCTQCHIKKHINKFGRDRGKIQARCKQCVNKYFVIWFSKNKDKKRKLDAEYRKNNREKRRIASKEYYWKNREREIEKKHQYRMANRKLMVERSTAYYKAHPDMARKRDSDRRARELGAKGTHTVDDERLQFKKQKGKCFYCGKKITKYHVDHVIPLARGGGNGIDNIVCACPHCNFCKHDKTPKEWHPILRR